MGLTASINLAINGLHVMQDATQLVGANVASSSTDGYTSKRLSIQGIQSNSGIVGFTTVVTRAFDQQLYDQLIASTASTSHLDVKNTYAAQIDKLMGTTSGGATLSSAIATFSSSLQGLASQPSDTSAQVQVVNTATALAQSLNSVSTQASTMATAVDGDINDAVTAVNDLTKQIADLNTKIVSYKTQGLDATNLEDSVDKAVLNLATYMDVQVKRQEDGSVRVSTNEALTLVDNARATTFQRDAKGNLVLGNAGGANTDVIGLGMIGSGSLSALYEVRNDTLPRLQHQFDQIAAGLASAMSDTTTAGTAVTSGTASGFSVDLSSLQSGNSTTLSYTDKTTGTSKTVTFVKVGSSTSLPLANDTTANPNDTVVGIDFSGGMSSVVSQIQSALGSAFAVSNPSGNTLQILDGGSSGTVSVDGLSATSTETSLQGSTKALPLFLDQSAVYTGSRDSGSQMDGLAARITVNSAVRAKPSLLVSYSTSTPSSDSTRPYKLYDALNSTTNWYTLEGSSTAVQKSLGGFSDTMVSYWGTLATNATTDLTNQKVVQSNLSSSLAAGSSVSTDTEMAKLIQLQSSYAANAHVLSTVRDMLNSLLQNV